MASETLATPAPAPSAGPSPGPGLAPGGAPVERRCAYSRCREPLPPPSPTGRPRRYCPSRMHVTADGRQVSCRQAGQAEELLAALHGSPALPAAGLARVGELLGAAVPATRELADLLAEVHQQLADDVATARTERDAALAAAVTAGETREAAEEEAARARREAVGATSRADEAGRDAGAARAEAAAAREAQVRAEARLADAVERAATAESAARDTASRAAEAAREHALERGAAAAALDELRRGLTEARETHAQSLERQQHEERDRLAAVRAEAAEQLAAARAHHDTVLTQLRETAASEVRAAAEEAARARGELQRATARHAADLAAVHERLGEHEARRASAAELAERADRALAGWRRRLLAALTAPDSDPAALRSAVRQLVSADPADRGSPGETGLGS